jgi:hypothetical protein
LAYLIEGRKVPFIVNKGVDMRVKGVNLENTTIGRYNDRVGIYSGMIPGCVTIAEGNEKKLGRVESGFRNPSKSNASWGGHRNARKAAVGTI